MSKTGILVVAVAAAGITLAVWFVGVPMVTAPTASPTGAAEAQFTLDTPIGTLVQNANAKAFLDRIMPGLTEGPHGIMVADMSINDLARHSPEAFGETKLRMIADELAKIH